jgi:two-component system sensor histidine kinase MtrB
MEDTKLHNGWLQAWGNKGSGSNFRLTIPLRQGEEIDRSPVQLEPRDIVLPGGQNDKAVLVHGPGPTPGSGPGDNIAGASTTVGSTAPGAAAAGSAAGASSTKDQS